MSPKCKKCKLPAKVCNCRRPMAGCATYTRPPGVLGGPCLNCGAPQPEHAQVIPSVVVDMPGRPVAAPCCLGGCHYSELTVEIARCLSPDNENVRCGYWVAALRDVQQILVTSRDNAKEAMAQLEALREQGAGEDL